MIAAIVVLDIANHELVPTDEMDRSASSIATWDLGVGSWYFFTDRDQWQMMVFSFLVFAHAFQSLASRSSKDSIFQRSGIFQEPNDG